MVGFYCHPVPYLIDRDIRSPGEKFGQNALMLRIEMLNQYKGHTGIGRKVSKY
jgi:hypothetical protein